VFADDGIEADPLRRRLRRLTRGERREEALAFVDQFHRENDLDPAAADRRKREVGRDLARLGFYEHTPEELAFGARVAWRHSARCIGRLFWKSLEVIDRRSVADPDAVAACVVDHLRDVSAGGRIPSAISIFAPVRGGALPPYIENAQVVQFAGYVEEAGKVRGDPLNAEFTRMASSLGWRPPAVRGDFDVLPLVIREAGGAKRLYPLPEDAYRIVDIRHPEAPALDRLGLRWYSVPIISDMILTIGGIDYPCAPFNGHYMATEIASRDLTDVTRYDVLPRAAAALGFSERDPLWKDRTLTELNAAVLWSFLRAGASIVDHHTASAQCIDFFQAELANGRDVSGDWSWITPPQASSACPVFHLPMKDQGDVPNYYRSRATDGAHLRLSRRNEERSRLRARLDRLTRRVRRWRRARFHG